MPRFAAGLEYDGRAYSGWQFQPGLQTVQDVVQRALSRVADAPVDCVCAGRTDAGVHAAGQVVHFDSRAVRTERGWRLGANTYLPPDVSVVWVREVPEQFHARFSATARSYRYLILNRDSRPALAAGRATWERRPLDAARMHAAAQVLVGEHDFSAFRAVGMPVQIAGAARRASRGDAQRRVGHDRHHRQCLPASHGAQRRGPADVGRARESRRRSAWPTVLASRDRRTNAATAPPDGLYLAAVRYPAGVRPAGRNPLSSAALSQVGRSPTDMSWFEKIMPSRIKTERRTRSVPEGLWIKCSACDAVLYRAELERNLNVCPKCSHHMRIGGRERLARFLDEGEQIEIGAERVAGGSAQVPRQQALSRPPRRGAEDHRRA